MLSAAAGDKEGGGGRRARGGRIPQGVQEQARRKDSPVINELLVEARKGRTKLVVQQDPDKAGGGGRRAQGGHIPQEVQKQARQKDSPVVSEVLVEARKGCTELVVQLLQQDPDKAAVTDRVCSCSVCGVVKLPLYLICSSMAALVFIWPASVGI